MARRPTLYGPDGNPVDRAGLEREHARPSLASVRQPWMLDVVAAGLTPDRLASVLRAADNGDTRELYALALEMEERPSLYGSALGVRRRAVLGVEPSVESASDDKRDVDLADELRELVRKPAFRKLLLQCLWGLGPGVSAVEILWDRSRGGPWMPARYQWRDPRWFRWGREDATQLRLLSDEDPSEGTPLAPFKWVVHAPSLRPGIPARGGLARPVAALYVLAIWSVADWAGWLEQYGRPIRLGKYGAGTSEEDRETLRRAVTGLGSNAAGVIPESMQVELVEAARSSSSDAYERFARWLDEQVSIAVLGQVATTQGTPGRLGSDDAQADVRMDILKGDCEELAETVSRDLVRAYVDLNHGPQERYPRVVLQPRDPEDVDALAKSLRMLVPLGLRVEASVVRDRLGWPDPPEGAETLEGPARPEPAGARSLAAAREPAAETGLLDELEGRALDGWERVMDPLLQPLRELVERSSTREEFFAGMADALGEMDDGPLRRALASAAFAARGLGDARDEP